MDDKEKLLNTPPEEQEQTDTAADGGSQHLIPTLEELTAKGIHEGIAAAVIGGDYDALKKAIDTAIAEEIDKRITANIPKTKQTEDFTNQLKTFESMGYKDRLELSRKNPRLYKELTSKILA